MFLGHFGLAFAAKKVAPKPSLGTLVLAAQLAALVLSHWVLDALSHRPDMPTWPGGPKVGAGLWYSLPASMFVELALYGAGVWLYVSATRARDRSGSVLLWAFVATLAVLYVASVFGPPPPDVNALAASALAGWLFVAWGYWIDRHRDVITAR